MNFRLGLVALLLTGAVFGCAEIKRAPAGTESASGGPSGEEEEGGSSGAPNKPGGPSSSSSGSSSSSSGSSSSSSSGGSSSSSGGSSSGGPGTISVEDFVTVRSRIGVRTTGGFGKWGGGLTVHDSKIYWVEWGSTPGLYSAPESCTTPATCAVQLAPITRAASFTTTATAILLADTTAIKRFPFATPGTVEPVAAAADDVVNLASDGTNVFWTASGNNSDDGAIRMTNPSGTTSTPINSNGTPIAMGLAGTKVYWAGVDISGLQGALQCINANGTQPKAVSTFTGGFEVIGGNALYMYYAKGEPAEIHRITLSTNHDDRVATNAMGVRDFAVNDEFAYWVEPGDAPDYANGRVRRVAHIAPAVSPGAPSGELIADSLTLPLAIAVNGNVVYVASGGTKPAAYANGKILRVTIH